MDWAEERANRATLIDAMAREGFAVNPREWWHFDHRLWQSYPVLDVPLTDEPVLNPDLQ